ncbi:hypothetical protein GF380_00395 [Candidatus Uhrbacteria bacterium]|nr:hypothetical protein [Candidatus Uhrbacteria bacterium]
MNENTKSRIQALRAELEEVTAAKYAAATQEEFDALLIEEHDLEMLIQALES